ncbi:hypothetical protein MD484_g8769, partial [Candolleomyces efflorescens]
MLPSPKVADRNLEPGPPPFDTVDPMVMKLDEAIVAAWKSDRSCCNDAKVLQSIVEPTLDIYHFCRPWGIYTFPLTNRVYAWFQYIVGHGHLVDEVGASMDWDFFLDPVFSTQRSGADKGKEVDEDGYGEWETGDEDEDDEGDDEDGTGSAPMVLDGDGGRSAADDGKMETETDGTSDARGRSGTKRKLSNPAPAVSSPPLKTKRSRTGTRSEGAPATSAVEVKALKDMGSGLGLTRYPVSCERCVAHSTVCYMQASTTKTARACEQCRRLKRTCSYRDRTWVSSLPSAARQRVQEEWASATPKGEVDKGKKKASSRGGRKRVEVPEKQEVSQSKQGGREVEGQEGGPVTRSKHKDPPQPPSTPSHPVYSLAGKMVGTHATIIKPVPEATPSSVPSRQPSPLRVVDSSNGKDDPTITDLTTLLEAWTKLDGEIADVQGQIRALNREVVSYDGVWGDIDRLHDRDHDLRSELEKLAESVKIRFETTTLLIEKMDSRSRMDTLKQTTERELGVLVVARENLERGHSVLTEKLEGIVARVGGLEEAVSSVRRDAVDGNGERIARVEQRLGKVQEDIRRERDDVFKGHIAASLAQAFEDALRRHEDRLVPRLTAIEQHLQNLDQRFNAVSVMLTQQMGGGPSYVVSRAPETSIAPKAVFPAVTASSTHFVAEMPRETPMSAPLISPHTSWMTPPSEMARRYTNFGTISASTYRSDGGGEIIPPPGFTGGKSGRRLDDGVHSVRQDGSPASCGSMDGGQETQF